jgi:NitT/TauT family transport system substrate-binding protein
MTTPTATTARRQVLKVLGAATWTCAAAVPRVLRAADQPVVTLSVPGPGNTVSAPWELAHGLGLDKAAGIALRLRFVGGGGVAIKDLESGNADFAVFGLPAAVVANADGSRLVVLAAMDDLPLYTLMLRADLRGQVRQLVDLRGRTIAVHSNSLATKTTSTQMAELVLRSAGVPIDTVRFIAGGQNWDTQSAVMRSRTADASMCDEPIGSRLEAEGLGSVLFSTGRPEDIARVPGAGFLRAALIARRDRVQADAMMAARVVDTALRTLRWIAANTPEAMADALQLAAGAERDAFLLMRRRFPRMFSRDGKFSDAQLRQTTEFTRASSPGHASLQSYDLQSMVVDRWVGRKP